MNAEAEFINAFVVPAKRARMVELLAKPKRRTKILNDLYHFDDFDQRYIEEIPSPDQTAEKIFASLRRRGAPERYLLLSADRELDQSELALSEAIEMIVGFCPGTVIICIPGRLAYYEGEDLTCRHLLTRPAA